MITTVPEKKTPRLKTRPITARWSFFADIELLSDARFGGGDGDVTDMTVAVDAATGRPLLKGSSLAGALRSHLADVLGGYFSKEKKKVCRLFGDRAEVTGGDQSALIVFESLGILPKDHSIGIRDGVSLNTATGVYETGALFSAEVIPRGTIFPIRLDLIVPNSEGESELLALLNVALSGLADYEIAMGARRTRGMGRLKTVNWRAARFDLCTADGWNSWLGSPYWAFLDKPSGAGETTLTAAIQTAFGAEVNSLPPIADRRARLVVAIAAEFKSGLLVRSAGGDPQGPDVAHLMSGGRPTLPGTGTAGALRTQARRIVSVVKESQGDAVRKAWVEALFGPEKTRGKERLFSSRLRVSEETVAGARKVRHTRIQIDRFTQGVVPHALVEEEVSHGGTFTLRLELRNPTDAAAGLLMLVVKDIRDALVRFGGTTGIGRGRLEEGTEVIVRRKLPEKDPEVQNPVAIQAWVDALHREKAPNETAPKEEAP